MSGAIRTPIAVALRYDRRVAGAAPVLVAKGRGEIGQAIIDTAREHGVPLKQNPALAEALSQVELDDQIPEALYRAVAEILAFILRTSGHLK
jgi:flagellar biosynthesis protein